MNTGRFDASRNSYPSGRFAWKGAALDETLSKESEYFEKSKYGSFTETSDEELSKRKSHFTRFDSSFEFTRFEVGFLVAGPKEFRQAVTNYAIAARSVKPTSKK